ncbi:MAG: hypothetical protein K2O18_06355, partial [Oscillospiraceae bacterium]|nr:hypothetical protein [Oscillospiraceae bacterium]
EGVPSPDILLTVNLSDKSIYAKDFEKTYDQKQTALPVAEPEGSISYTVRYTGKTCNGVSVNGIYPPSEAGNYTAEVAFNMRPGYPEITPFSVSYVIHQVEPEFNTPVRVAYTMNNSIGLIPVEGAEYRMDNGPWQESPTFTRLSPDTSYTFYQRLKASADGNYKASAETSAQAATQGSTQTGIAVPFYSRFQSKVYDGTGLFDEGTSYPVDLGGTTVTVTVSAYLSEDFSEIPALDAFQEENSVENPTSAGPYIIRSTLPAGYVWADTGTRQIDSSLWICPKFGEIYVGDAIGDITMEAGSAEAYASNYALSFDLLSGEGSNVPFNTSRTGKTTVPVLVTAVNGGKTHVIVVNIPDTVIPWTVTNKDVPTVKIANDAQFKSSMLPAQMTVTAKAR